MLRIAAFGLGALLLLTALPASAASGGSQTPAPMSMPDKPASFPPTVQAYTADHRFLVKLLSLPRPVPYEKYFDLRFAVYDGRNPAKRLPNASLAIDVGMRHNLKHGFAHGMQSAPKIIGKDGEFDVSGMYFHMMGPWTLKAMVHEGADTGTAYFELPCCGQ